jgi:hypothetical protein
MLDPWVNSIQFIWNYASLNMAMHIVTMHDDEMLMPFLFNIYNKLTLTFIIIEFVNVGHELGMLGPWLQLMKLY